MDTLQFVLQMKNTFNLQGRPVHQVYETIEHLIKTSHHVDEVVWKQGVIELTSIDDDSLEGKSRSGEIISYSTLLERLKMYIH